VSYVNARDDEGNSRLLTAYRKNPERILEILLNDLHICEAGLERPEGWKGWSSWMTLCLGTKDECVEIVEAILEARRKFVTKLAYCKTWLGRVVFELALPACRAAIQKRLLFNTRYRLNDKPVHASDTSLVYYAMDCKHATCAEHERPVALKFIQMRDHFDREVAAQGRFKSKDSEDYVLGFLECHDGDADEEFARSADACGLCRFCIVMQRADR